MDDPALDDASHALALAGLKRINRMSRTAAGVYREIRGLRGDRPTRVLDLACGGGDVTLALARRAVKAGDRITVDGVDVSERAVARCNAAAQAQGLASRFEVLNAVSDSLPEGYDLAISTLFFHHLTDEDATAVLAKMGRACEAVVISDLARSRRALALTHVGVHVLSRSPVVHVDGPRSTRAGWRREELEAMARRAGMQGATVRSAFPFRWVLSWGRGSGGGVSASRAGNHPKAGGGGT